MKKSIIFLVVMFGTCTLSCKKTDQNIYTEECNVTLQDTSFKIKELIGLSGHQQFFETDKIVASRNAIYLSASDTTADNYFWTIEGYTNTFTGKSTSFIVDQPVGKIKITLTQKRNPSNTCLGTYPDEVKFIKYLMVVSGTENPLIGDYYGYNKSNKVKSFSITVLQNGLKNLPFPTTGNYYFQNELQYGSSAFYIAGGGTYDPDYGAYATQGFGYLKDNKYLEIDYQYKLPSPSSAIIIKDTFYGIKQ